MSESVETCCVQGGYQPKNGEPREVPIVQSTTFAYENSSQMGDLFDLKASGYFYSRLQNPTLDSVAAKICELEGGSAAIQNQSVRKNRKGANPGIRYGCSVLLDL